MSEGPDYGPGESFDGNPFGKPGSDFRKQDRIAEAAKEEDRLARLRAAANIPEPPPPMEEEPKEDASLNTPVCTACAIQ
eukprot:CAMPEP_0171632700 /NCGR_PEP_ID=MMETSP0990-20121206/24644_1 /TAXON_ID=483369 /ORGANISM="non described non described, Strain CCMP2098" /LENGTH=78 /DNA_ID=CAMNT_0012203037 /DNA_START=41 /DNA_END=277 /DNA_ORIENTATION=+